MTAPLETCITRIRSAEGNVVGAGFLAADRQTGYLVARGLAAAPCGTRSWEVSG